MAALAAFVGSLLTATAGCGPSDAAVGKTTPYVYEGLPDTFPQPPPPPQGGVPLTVESVELGRYLFYDKRLSYNETLSCGGCHQQQLAFTDGLPTSMGSTGQTHTRAAMNLSNVVYQATFTWANDTVRTLEDQAALPMFGESPIIELGLGGHEDEMLDRLRADPMYQDMFQAAFPGEDDPFTVPNVLGAIASFERTFISHDSPYDRFVAGDNSAMSDSAVRGMNMFFSEKFECFHCHGGFNFSDSFDSANNAFDQAAFHNTGLYNIDGRGAYPPDNTGLYAVSNDYDDMGAFKAPSLRNIALTAPYMHDGTIATLSDVLDFYAAGGRNITSGPNAGDGRLNPYKDIFVVGFDLSDQERADMLAFLNSLTDDTFVNNPDYADPF